MSSMGVLQTIQIENYILRLQFIWLMMRIGLRTLQLVALVALVCLVPAHCDAFKAQVTCQKCKMSCAVANCFRLAAEGYDRETCPSVACELNYNQTITVNKCAYDYEGNTCSTNVCLAPTQIGYCATTALGFTTCDPKDTYYFEVTCIPCTGSTATATYCLQKTYYYTNSGKKAQTPIPLGSTCKGVENSTSYVYPCTRDMSGGSCKCCANTTSGTTKPSVCSTRYETTSNQGFFTYAYNRTQFNSSYYSTAFEAHQLFILAMFCLMLFFV